MYILCLKHCSSKEVSDDGFDNVAPILNRSIPVLKRRRVYDETKDSESPPKHFGLVPLNCSRCTLKNLI